ncbi:MAG: alpha/beta hydrolase [Bacteroidetes Order II. Incertae sedis bacterium]|nr:alpha/beta hydrolase [Bacteroidetes Order II. bacterium]
MLRKCFLLLLCLPSVAVGQSSADTVLFRIDLRTAIKNGTFNPQYEQIGIRGGQPPLSWATSVMAFDVDQDGIYEAAVIFAKNDARSMRVSYKFKIEHPNEGNSGWEDGPNRTVVAKGKTKIERVFNAPPEATPPTFTGKIITHSDFNSKYLPVRNIFVYLPPNYDHKSRQRYPVLYMHDGRNVLDASVIGQEWEMDETAEQLIPKGEIPPFILVAIDNTPHRIFEYTHEAIASEGTQILKRIDPSSTSAADLLAAPGRYGADFLTNISITAAERSLWLRSNGSASMVKLEKHTDGTYHSVKKDLHIRFLRDANSQITGVETTGLRIGGGGTLYGKMLVEEIKPFIDRTYRTLKAAKQTFVGGSSLGGLLSMYLGMTYPDVFSGLLVVSPSVWWNGERVVQAVQTFKHKHRPKIWIDMGTAEGTNAVPSTDRLVAALRAKGWTTQNLNYVVIPNAQHNEVAWAQRAPDMLRFLFSHIQRP